jgi:hypothetical protein
VGLVESEVRLDTRDEIVLEPGSPQRLTHRLEGVDLATGDVRWSARSEVGVVAGLVGTPGAPQLVSFTADGVVEVRDLGTGRVLATRALLQPIEVFRAVAVAVVGDMLVLHTWRGRWLLAGYRLPSLEPRWTLPVPSGMAAEPCGVVVCLSPQASGPAHYTEAVSPVDGTRSWWILDGRVQSIGGRLFALDADGVLRGAIDEATGRTVRDLAGWWPVSAAPPDTTHLTLVAPGGGGVRTLLARLERASLTVTFLGSVPHVLTDCQGFPGGLVCHDERDRIGVWRLPG